MKGHWPEFFLTPILVISLLELMSLAKSIPFSDLQNVISFAMFRGLLLACMVYIGAHVLRAARLSLLLGVGKLPLGSILGCNSLISLVTFAMPFKLGEVARAVEFYRLTSSNPRAILAIWLERCFDAVIVLCLIELASSSLMDSTTAQLTRRGLMALLGFSFFMMIFGRSALAALLRLLSSSHSLRSMMLMRFVRKIEAFFLHLPPLTQANLALLFILTCGIWMLEIFAILIVMAGLTGWQHGAISALVGLISSAVTGSGSSSAEALLLYRLMVMGSLGVLSLLMTKFYFKERIKARPKDNRAQLYQFEPRSVLVLDEQNARIR